ncbi:MAG: FkbM family methyltransferase [Gammaproteobacteria bacterium]|nr:FkbM family methyltransferase [Gammaproteobacteria bacterium]
MQNLLEFLAAYPQLHARNTPFYKFVDELAKSGFQEAKPAFEAGEGVPLGELGTIRLPYVKMGAIDSLDLFGLDELLMFAFYFCNRGRYKRVADIGANIGLHSIVLARCGLEVEAYEPDPSHFDRLVSNLALNKLETCKPYQRAVSEKNGTMQFVRVLGNTTSSHLAGAKPNPYGELERFDVSVVDIREIAARVDLFKIDAEGHECEILEAIPRAVWRRLCCVLEIGTPRNARRIHSWAKKNRVNIRAQKIFWNSCRNLADLPKSYREGSVIISANPITELWPQARKHN